MITMLDIETGETLERSARPDAPGRALLNGSSAIRLPQPGLQEIALERPAVRMPPDLASLDIAEVLARFQDIR